MWGKQTPPLPKTPPPASVEDTRVHQPRIQQCCQTGCTTELPAVEHRPRPPEPQSVSMHPGPEGKLAPGVLASCSEEKTAARQDTFYNPLFNERGGPSQPSFLVGHTQAHTASHGRPVKTAIDQRGPQPGKGGLAGSSQQVSVAVGEMNNFTFTLLNTAVNSFGEPVVIEQEPVFQSHPALEKRLKHLLLH